MDPVMGCFDHNSSNPKRCASRSCSWKTVVSRDFAWKLMVETVRSSWRAPWSWPREAANQLTDQWIQWDFLQKTWGRWLGQQGDGVVVFRLNTMVTRTWGGEDDGFWVKCMFERLKVTSSIVGNFPRLVDGHVCLFRGLHGLLFNHSGTCEYLLSLKKMPHWHLNGFNFLFWVAVWNMLDMVLTYEWLFLNLSQVFIHIFSLILRNQQGPLLFFAWATCWLSFNKNFIIPFPDSVFMPSSKRWEIEEHANDLILGDPANLLRRGSFGLWLSKVALWYSRITKTQWATG